MALSQTLRFGCLNLAALTGPGGDATPSGAACGSAGKGAGMATLPPAGQAPSRYLALSRRQLTIAVVTLRGDRCCRGAAGTVLLCRSSARRRRSAVSRRYGRAGWWPARTGHRAPRLPTCWRLTVALGLPSAEAVL